MTLYSILYADCAWEYLDNDNRGSAERHYPSLSTKELCNLPIEKLAAEQSVLFLWATWPNLKEGLQVLEAWGFTYKTIGFIYIKTNKDKSLYMGLGHYTRSNTEPCLLGTRGKPLVRQNKGISSVIISPRLKHSKKPPEVRERIVSLYGDLPRIELFAREKVPGWNYLGNEVGTGDIRETLNIL